MLRKCIKTKSKAYLNFLCTCWGGLSSFFPFPSSKIHLLHRFTGNHGNISALFTNFSENSSESPRSSTVDGQVKFIPGAQFTNGSERELNASVLGSAEFKPLAVDASNKVVQLFSWTFFNFFEIVNELNCTLEF